jgi:hypothetical protein
MSAALALAIVTASSAAPVKALNNMMPLSARFELGSASVAGSSPDALQQSYETNAMFV